MKPIVVDIETSGLDRVNHGIWQIGAVNMNNPERSYFLEEGRIDDYNEVTQGALKITGKTEEELRSRDKISQKQLMTNFFDWVKEKEMKTFVCQNPQFDLGFFEVKSGEYGLKMPQHYRAFDLHSVAQTAYQGINGDFLIEGDHSGMGLKQILEFCGIEDKRKEHNALEDARLTAECFSRIIYGENLLKEYKNFEIPGELI